MEYINGFEFRRPSGDGLHGVCIIQALFTSSIFRVIEQCKENYYKSNLAIQRMLLPFLYKYKTAKHDFAIPSHIQFYFRILFHILPGAVLGIGSLLLFCAAAPLSPSFLRYCSISRRDLASMPPSSSIPLIWSRSAMKGRYMVLIAATAIVPAAAIATILDPEVLPADIMVEKWLVQDYTVDMSMCLLWLVRIISTIPPN